MGRSVDPAGRASRVAPVGDALDAADECHVGGHQADVDHLDLGGHVGERAGHGCGHRGAERVAAEDPPSRDVHDHGRLGVEGEERLDVVLVSLGLGDRVPDGLVVGLGGVGDGALGGRHGCSVAPQVNWRSSPGPDACRWRPHDAVAIGRWSGPALASPVGAPGRSLGPGRVSRGRCCGTPRWRCRRPRRRADELLVAGVVVDEALEPGDHRPGRGGVATSAGRSGWRRRAPGTPSRRGRDAVVERHRVRRHRRDGVVLATDDQRRNLDLGQVLSVFHGCSGMAACSDGRSDAPRGCRRHPSSGRPTASRVASMRVRTELRCVR